MPTLVLCTLVLLSLFAFAWAAGSAYIDDSDSRILYSGSWTKNPISDPESFNYGGTLTYTNDATAKATLTFSGAIQVTVVGSFPVAGTFAMHSSYSIDGTGVTQFEPPSVISHPAYRQQFFVSNTLSTGTHELVIANLGRAFYLDYIVLTVPASSTPSLSSTPTHSSAPSVPSQSTTNPPTQLVALSTVVVVTQVEAPTTQIIQASKGLASIYSSNRGSSSFSAPPETVNSSIVTSGFPSSIANATQNGSSPVTSTGSSQRSGAVVLPPGIYAAIGVGGLTVIVLVVAGAYFLRRRRRLRSKPSEVNPFDPGLTSHSAEKSQFLPRSYTHVNRVSASSAASTSYHSAPPYTPVDENSTADSIGHAASEGDVLRIVPEMPAARRDVGTYEPLVSPSAVSPLIPGRSGGQHCDRNVLSPALSPLTSSPISPASDSKRAHCDTRDFRRRSLDGGMRLAGGPSGVRRDADMADVDAHSAVSTLPPLYDSYPAL